jgi:Ca-activated chloride channel homolog
MIRPIAASLVCGILLSVPAVPQQPQPPQQQEPSDTNNARIQINVNEVIVPVTVTDDRGRFVSNLEANDFRLLDEGKPQHIEFFSHAPKQPIVVGFLMDTSSSVRTHWKRYQDSLKELVWNLLSGDKRYTGYLIAFGNQAELLVNTTWDADKITDEITKLEPGGGAALFDAIYQACTKRDTIQGEPFEPRRVIVLMGDGHDNLSKKTLEEVIELAQRNQITIYAISTQAFGFDNPDSDILERLSTETGGHVEYPLQTIYKGTAANTYFCDPSDEGCYSFKVGTGGYEAAISASIIRAVGGISGDITSQYVLRYVPAVDPDERAKPYHRIQVQVDLPNVTVRARHGYYPAGVPVTPNAP